MGRFNIKNPHFIHAVYSTVIGFWSVEEVAELVGGPTGRGELARSECLFACSFSVTRSNVPL
jgi:hypothetical protein